jgi:hypothetical protein
LSGRVNSEKLKIMLFQLKVKHNNFSRLTLSSSVNYGNNKSRIFNKQRNVARIRSCEYRGFQSLRIRYTNIYNWLNTGTLQLQVNEVKINPIRYFLSQQNRNSITGEVNFLSRTIQVDLHEKGFEQFVKNWHRFERVDAIFSVRKDDADFYEGIVQKISYDYLDDSKKEIKRMPINNITFNFN